MIWFFYFIFLNFQVVGSDLGFSTEQKNRFFKSKEKDLDFTRKIILDDEKKEYSKFSRSNLDSEDDEKENSDEELDFTKIEDIPTEIIMLFIRNLKSDLRVTDQDLGRYVSLRNKYIFVNQKQMDSGLYPSNFFLRVLNIDHQFLLKSSYENSVQNSSSIKPKSGSPNQKILEEKRKDQFQFPDSDSIEKD